MTRFFFNSPINIDSQAPYQDGVVGIDMDWKALVINIHSSVC
jgi:hypothetical protein